MSHKGLHDNFYIQIKKNLNLFIYSPHDHLQLNDGVLYELNIKI